MLNANNIRQKYSPLPGILIVAIIGLALWLRVVGVQWGLPNANHSNSYMPDENNWISIMSRMEPSKLNLNPHNLSIPTFHFYLVGAGMQIASFLNYVKIPSERGHFFSLNHPDEYAKLFLIGRLFSVGMGVMTIWFMYLIGRDLYSRRVGIVASLFLTVIPSHIIHSHFFHVNVPVTFWILLSFYFTTRILRSRKIIWYLLTGITAGLGMSTKYTAFLLFIPLTVAHLLRENGKYKAKDIIISLFSKRLCAGYLTILLLFVMGSPYIFLSWPDFVSGVSLLSHLGFESSSQVIDWIKPITVIRYAAGLPLSIVSAMGLVLLIMRRDKSDILILTWVIPFYLVSVRIVYYVTDSRLVPLLPFLCLSAAVFLIQSIKFRLQRQYLNYLRIAAVAILLVYNLLFSLSINSRFYGQDVQDNASDWILENIPAGTNIGYETRPYWWAPYIHYSPTDRSLLQKYPLIICEWDKNILKKEKPPYFVATDLTFHELPWGVNNWPQYEDFREYLRKNYRVVKVFNKEFRFGWFRTAIETRPDKGTILDIYYQPIYILKRLDEGDAV
ncbi:MAG: hypothetical protein A3G93_15210 [Nitrospinae bacterium RIFCSPLOWO2_12_FULL_45_22]|nr:MAG: hypothetical protein A3G93_15210 [Nitrospinae bacterium RIFCSPLOWO2_12_FULL_45_22]